MFKLVFPTSLLFLIILCCIGSYAQGVDLSSATVTVCNQGKIPVNVVKGTQTGELFGNTLEVSGWINVDPGKCEQVFHGVGSPDTGAARTYLGFGFFDTQNHLMSGHVSTLPDFGRYRFGTPVLTTANDRFCVRDDGMAYRIREHAALNCATFRFGGGDPGGYTSFPAVLRIMPIPSKCSSAPYGGPVMCSYGDYFLDVKATSASAEMQVSGRVGKDQASESSGSGASLGDVMTALGNAAAAQRQKQADANAKVQAAARQTAKVCISESMYPQWMNPDSKMREFKQHFKHGLQLAAQDPSGDMDVIWLVDDRYYPGYVPGGSINKVVSSISSNYGGCGTGAYKLDFVFNP